MKNQLCIILTLFYAIVGIFSQTNNTLWYKTYATQSVLDLPESGSLEYPCPYKRRCVMIANTAHNAHTACFKDNICKVSEVITDTALNADDILWDCMIDENPLPVCSLANGTILVNGTAWIGTTCQIHVCVNEQITIEVAENCATFKQFNITENGIQDICPFNKDISRPVSVVCDHLSDTGGWTVFQTRKNVTDRIDFNLDYLTYQNGFGHLNAEFWLGLDNIRAIVETSTNMELRVNLNDFEGNYVYAQYSFFNLGDEASEYTITVSGYSGTAGDSLEYHDGMKFSTYDHDPRDCAGYYLGPWWYNNCYESILNGQPFAGTTSGDGIVWYDFKGWDYSVECSMMMRPV